MAYTYVSGRDGRVRCAPVRWLCVCRRGINICYLHVNKTIVICVRLLMKQAGDCVMTATLVSVVRAPLREFGLDPSTWKPVHRVKRARAVRSVFSGCMGSFKRARAVLPKVVVPSTNVALMRLSCALHLSHAGTTTADLCNHLAGMAIIRRPLRSRQPAPPLFTHQLEKMALAVDQPSSGQHQRRR
jgi:hypothetical protein